MTFPTGQIPASLVPAFDIQPQFTQCHVLRISENLRILGLSMDQRLGWASRLGDHVASLDGRALYGLDAGVGIPSGCPSPLMIVVEIKV